MNKIAAVRTVAGALLLLSACGPGGKSSAVSSEAELLGIVSLSVAPGTTRLYAAGEHADLACTALMLDGTSRPQAAGWTATGAAVTLGPVSGAIVTATAAGNGPVTVTASFAGLEAHAVVLAGSAAITDPGTVFGGNSSGGGLYRYPGDPDADLIQIDPLTGYQGDGLVLDASGSFLYAIAYDATNPVGTQSIFKCATAGGQLSVFVPLPGSSSYKCLSFDPQGNLYTLDFPTGDVYKISPAGVITLHCSSGYAGANFMDGMVVGWDPLQQRADVPFYFSASSVVLKWIYRQDFDAGLALKYADPPAEVASTFFPATGGLAIDASGVIYAMAMTSNAVYRYQDLNADGDGGDAGELKLFATLPLDLSGGFEWMTPFIARGGSLVVNVGCFGQLMPADAGVYWIVDRDPAHETPSGMAEEVAKYHPQWMEGSNSGSFQYLACRP